MSYGSGSGVASRCGNTLAGASNFSASTVPSSCAVNGWLSTACAIIESRLSGGGYSVPPTANTIVYDWLVDLNNLYGSAQVEMSRVNVTLGPGERTRGQVFEKMFWDGLDRLCSTDLTLVGLSRISDDAIYVGGTTETQKDIWEDDTDRVVPRFTRGMHNFEGTIRPDAQDVNSDND